MEVTANRRQACRARRPRSREASHGEPEIETYSVGRDRIDGAEPRGILGMDAQSHRAAWASPSASSRPREPLATTEQMKRFAFILPALITVGLGGCASPPEHCVEYVPAPQAFSWPAWPTNAPPETNQSRFVLPPPLLQLPEQQAAREEVERSGVSPAIVQKMLQGQFLTLGEIQELAQLKVSDTNIVRYLRSTGATYTLTSEQIDELRSASVSTKVVNYLLSTPAMRGTIYYSPRYLYRPGFSWWGDHHDYDWHHHDFHHEHHHH